MDKLYFEEWYGLSLRDKEQLMSDIEQIPDFPLKLKIVSTYELNGKSVDLALFESGKEDSDEENNQFVFVPGRKNITLGWDNESCPLSVEIIDYMERYFKGYYEYLMDEYEALDEVEKADTDVPEEATIEDWLEYVDKMTSPLRTVDISPMLVQVDTIHPSKNNKSKLCPPFAIPTEDEWEYLRSCGQRNFFPFPDDYLEQALENVYGMASSAGSRHHPIDNNFFDRVNDFGLWFDSSTYCYELVNAACFAKGADGGGSVCGADGTFYTAPILSAFYTPKLSIEKLDRISEEYYAYRRIIHVKE